MGISGQKIIVHKTRGLQGQARIPGSKSQSIRALMVALLAKGKSVLKNVLDSEDTQHAIHVCEQLGSHLQVKGHEIVMESQGLPLPIHSAAIYSGNSGITTRFIMPILGLSDNPQPSFLLDCGEQMRARQIKPLIEALTQLGLTITYAKQTGQLPVTISGRLKGGVASVTGITSQYISALLLALPCAAGDSVITVTDLHERPYMEMTLQWLQQQRIRYQHQRLAQSDVFHLAGGQCYQPLNITIPGDFSSASYLMAAAALMPGQVELHGLDMQDPQGDKRLVNILQEMGADITLHSSHVLIRGGKKLSGIRIDANDIPDLLPTLAVLGTQAQGKTEIFNVQQARIKETDRIHSMTQGLRRLSARVEEYEDGMTVYHSELRGNEVRGYDDHRTVMALCIAGLFAEGDTIVNEGQALNKTFPTFLTIMQSLGADMEVQHVSA